MARAPERAKRAAPRRTAARSRPASASSAGTKQQAPVRRTWLLVVGAILGLLLVWRVIPALLGGAAESGTPDDASPSTSSTGPVLAGEAPPPPPGAESVAFPAVLDGTRLQLKVVTLGDDPRRCRAELLETGDDRRAVFHHRCVQEDGLDRYFFFVRLVNLTEGRVTVELDRFEVEARGGARVPLDSIPAWSSSERFFPQSDGIVPGGTLKGWITVDGTDGFVPKGLTYADGEERLTVEFDGRWV